MMEDRKHRAAVLIIIALIGLLINVIMFAAGIGNWLIVGATLACAIYGGMLLRPEKQQ